MGKEKKNREKVLQKKGRKVSKIKNKNKKGHMQKREQSRKKGDGIVDVIMGIEEKRNFYILSDVRCTEPLGSSSFLREN
jgi:predicted ribosome quality control (RQC) complex YloA/Tae2 family protein